LFIDVFQLPPNSMTSDEGSMTTEADQLYHWNYVSETMLTCSEWKQKLGISDPTTRMLTVRVTEVSRLCAKEDEHTKRVRLVLAVQNNLTLSVS